ncbi:MAG: P-II family nitrogen regulator [Aigarchaeota archaeon]|nr:P-II family nitrogen regulator [Aigarchaeota archaeon]MDW8093035.1 P-II family nitrogen regulator [Nitrososphaerota archaeon]
MKMIHAIIRPEKIDEVKRALEQKGFVGLTLYEVRGRGRQSGVSWRVRGSEFKIDLLPKVKLEIIVNDEEVEEVVKTIMENARTGEIGDGKIFVTHVEEAFRVRTGERGLTAIE